LGAYREQFVSNPHLNYWLNQGWSSTSIIINFGVTICGLWLGSVFGKTSLQEKQRTEEFFQRLKTPYIHESADQVKSPFPAIGVIVMIMGAGMTAVALGVRYLYPVPGWFGVNITAAIVLLIIGLCIWFFSKDKGKV
ncbi:MAG: hypothetical protein WCU00_08960, partial [Candidatus Latescibacterota bacterium]